MKILIVSVEPSGKTARYLTRHKVDFYYCVNSKYTKIDWPENTLFYEDDEQGANIAHKHAMRDFGDVIVLDDDYSSISCGAKSVKANSAFFDDVYDAFKDIEKLGFCAGGYSGGAQSQTYVKNNIMQIFVNGRIEPYFRNKRLYRLNDDVNACIMATLRGDLPVGIYAVRTAQEGELIDNTNNYNGRSYDKSFISVMLAPAYCSIEKTNLNLRPRWHHRVEWKKMRPKIINEENL